MPSVFHEPVIRLAVETQERSAKLDETDPQNLVRGALLALTLDAIRVHRAIGCLADAGWAGEAVPLLRTGLDLNISALAIVRGKDPEISAFRYFYSGLRRHHRDQLHSRDVRKRILGQIRSNLAKLSGEKRAVAVSVLKEKDRPYWFGAEFSSPTDILAQFSHPDLIKVYYAFSGGAHGSFFGLRLFRESPDSRSVNAERPSVRALSADMTSCRLLVELLEVRSRHELLGMENQLSEMRAELRKAALAAGMLADPAV